MALNYSTTWKDETDFVSSLKSTWLYDENTDIFDTESTDKTPTTTPTPRPKGPKGSKGSKQPNAAISTSGAMPSDYNTLELKEFLVVISVVLITCVIVATIYSLFIKNKRDQIIVQWKSKAGKIFLISFTIALISFYMTAITMTYFMFGLDNIAEGERPWLLCFGKIPYQIGRFMMEYFFILRLHFIFGRSAKSVPEWVLISLMILSFVELVLGCIASMGSRSVYNWYDWDPEVDTGPR